MGPPESRQRRAWWELILALDANCLRPPARSMAAKRVTIGTTKAHGRQALPPVPVSITSTDTAAVMLTVLVHDGTTSYAVGEIAVPAGAGTNGSALAVKGLSLAFLPWLDASGSLFLRTGWSLRVAAKAAITSTKTVTLVAFSGDY